jgi:hypothetical protein
MPELRDTAARPAKAVPPKSIDLPRRQSGRIQRQESRQSVKCRSARRMKFADVGPINAIEDAECPLPQLPAN